MFEYTYSQKNQMIDTIEDCSSEIVTKIARFSGSSLRRKLALKESPLPLETWKTLAEDGDYSVLKAVVNNPYFPVEMQETLIENLYYGKSSIREELLVTLAKKEELHPEARKYFRESSNASIKEAYYTRKDVPLSEDPVDYAGFTVGLLLKVLDREDITDKHLLCIAQQGLTSVSQKILTKLDLPNKILVALVKSDKRGELISTLVQSSRMTTPLVKLYIRTGTLGALLSLARNITFLEKATWGFLYLHDSAQVRNTAFAQVPHDQKTNALRFFMRGLGDDVEKAYPYQVLAKDSLAYLEHI